MARMKKRADVMCLKLVDAIIELEMISSRICICRRTYRDVSLGIMAPEDKVSTRSINGIMERTLWCEENGVSQCRARL